jgi:NAD+ synthase
MTLHENSLTIKNIKEVTNELHEFIKDQTFEKFRRKGAVIGISGGIDSAVVSVLCANAIESGNMLGLIMPEKDSSPNSKIYAELVSKKFNIQTTVLDLTQILDAFGVYEKRDNIILKYFKNFDNKCKYRIVVPDQLTNKTNISIPHLEILDTNNQIHKIKINLKDYLEITAITNIKHRCRMITLYHYAEKNHFVVAGTTNKSELMQGYFVKYGDGGVDIDPIAGLYKSQVYQLAHHLGIPTEIIQRKASPDTWSLEVSDEEFFYGLPYKTLDLLWFAKENNIPVSEISRALCLSVKQIERIFDNQQRKWKSSQHMRSIPPQGKPNIILS